MPLVKSTLEGSLKQALKQDNWDTAASQMATAIDNYIKSATVEVPALGLASPPGVAGGPVTGKATGSIK